MQSNVNDSTVQTCVPPIAGEFRAAFAALTGAGVGFTVIHAAAGTACRTCQDPESLAA